MIDFLIKLLGDPNNNKIKKMLPVVEHINALEPEFIKLSDDELRNKTEEFKKILATRPTSNDIKKDRELEKQALDSILPEAFATVRVCRLGLTVFSKIFDFVKNVWFSKKQQIKYDNI
ncbi:TPA: hypothetical protein IAA87_07190 [Candidatus Avigastranaerophilus faecigallinarum]|nr:hypothetical protein [Candidatus Avigastranaerophilus faecigallinarum]